jgi:uncharacterized protein YaiE (UPF0345 family)
MSTSPQFDHASITKRANIYFDGKCVSHSFVLADGSRKSLGVIFPSTLTFGTQAPEVMDVQAGVCRIRLNGSNEWTQYKAGDSFSVDANSSFDIEVIETLDYICHYG